MSATILQFKLTTTSTQPTLIDYVNAVADVSGYTYALVKTEAPVLNQPFPSYGDFLFKLAPTKSHALNWNLSILPNFQAVPASFVNFNDLLQRQISNLQTDFTSLKEQPNNTAIINSIQTSLSTLQSEIKNILNANVALGDSLNNFTTTLGTDGQVLKGLADAAQQAEKGDQAQIQKLQDVITSARNTIATMNERMTLEKFGQWDLKILLVFAGMTVGLVVGSPIGALIVGLVGATITAFIPIGGTVVKPEDIKKLQEQIDSVSQEIGALNTDLGILQAIATQFNQLGDKASSLNQSLTQVINLWQGLDNNIQQVLTDINLVLSEGFTPEGIDSTLADLEQTSKDWNEVEQFASTLAKIQYNFDPQVKTASSAIA